MENIEKIGCKSGKRNEAFTTEMSPARHMNSSQGNVPPFLQLSSGITSTKGKRRQGTKHRLLIIQTETESRCCNPMLELDLYQVQVPLSHNSFIHWLFYL